MLRSKKILHPGAYRLRRRRRRGEIDDEASFRLLFGAHVENLARVPETKAAGQRARRLVESAVRAHLEATKTPADVATVFRALWAQAHGVAWLTLEKELGPHFGRDHALTDARQNVKRLLAGFAAT